ncbi:MAG TPA: hypothetical protein VNF29_11190 [Candidatus Binataceae bacterium]|nr:hypothetical protein [Candidatus Binataceae bacterium]
MEIKVPNRFIHAGDLDARSASQDPRRASFTEHTLDIDLRECDFVQPAALLWCVIYPLLAAQRGATCRLLVPENYGVALYLKSAGLFGQLQQASVEVDDRGITTRADPQLILPLTRFNRESDVESLANQALDRLRETGVGAANLYPVVGDVFAELALNAVQHSHSSIDAFGFIQFYESEARQRFICVVADGGVGIRRSLERNAALRPRIPYDWDAIELALEEGVSGTGSNRRGIGLFGVAEEMSKPGRQLIIHSGIGLLQQTGGTNQPLNAARTLVTFPGTLIFASILT